MLWKLLIAIASATHIKYSGFGSDENFKLIIFKQKIMFFLS